jgi:hypothetical protein
MSREGWSLRKTLILAAVAIGIVKLVFFLLDPSPIFYYGDSENYLHAAFTELTETDRPYLYGALVRLLAVWPGSLTVLVASQVLASAAAAWLAVFCLVRFLDVRPAIALALGVGLAVGPLQLLQERMVLPETFTCFGLALFLTVGLSYIVRPAATKLLLSCLLGILLVALRTVYVPLAVASVVLLPLLALARDGEHAIARLLVHVAIAAALTFCLHASYRWNLARHSGYTGTYQQNDGFYVAGAWIPVIEPADGPDPRIAAIVESLPTSGPDSRRHLWNRTSQHYSEDGLVSQLIRAHGGDDRAANLTARELARNALKRDPLGVSLMAAKTYLGFLGIGWSMGWQAVEDQGEYRTMTLAMRREVRERFGLDAGENYQRRKTLIKSHHRMALPWYVCLALSPFLLVGALFFCRARLRPLVAFVLCTNGLLLGATCFGAELSAVRFLHPLAFGCVLGMGVIIDHGVRRSNRGEAAARP